MSALPEFLQFNRKRRLDGSSVEMPEPYAPRNEMQPTGKQTAGTPLPQPTGAPTGGVALSQTQPPDDSRPEWMKTIPQVVENISTTPPNASTPDAATRPRLADVPSVRESDVPLTDTLARGYSTRPRRAAPFSAALPSMPSPSQPARDESTVQTTPQALGTQITPQAIKPLPPTLVQMAGVDESGATFDRERIADPQGRLEKQIAYEQANPAKDRNGWWSILKTAGFRALDGFARGGLPGAVRGGIVGGIQGAVDKSSDERLDQQQHIHSWQQQLAERNQNERQKIDLDDLRAGVRLRNAQSKYYEARPDLQAKKDADAALTRERNAVAANLRLLKGQRLDPTNPRHAVLLERAANAGIEVDPDAWNNSASNLTPVDVVDPQNPTQKRRQYYNKATGELSDVGQSGYVAPIHSDTQMTSAQEHTDADRDAARVQRQAQYAQSHALSVANYQQRLAEAREHIRHNMEMETNARKARGNSEVRTRLSYNIARQRAKRLNIDFPDYEELLGEAGGEIDKDAPGLTGGTFKRSTIEPIAKQEGKSVDALVKEIESLGGIVVKDK